MAHVYHGSTWEIEAKDLRVQSHPELQEIDPVYLKDKQSQAVLLHTFNPSTCDSEAFNPSSEEVETGRDMAGRREE